mmetsp:Transcript_58505/g.119665  ORF Transcript_58505/g.119665 Transcript_58505/m.119665 type:complete len:315 (-) Transcript_58505:241-1185(-)
MSTSPLRSNASSTDRISDHSTNTCRRRRPFNRSSISFAFALHHTILCAPSAIPTKICFVCFEHRFCTNASAFTFATLNPSARARKLSNPARSSSNTTLLSKIAPFPRSQISLPASHDQVANASLSALRCAFPVNTFSIPDSALVSLAVHIHSTRHRAPALRVKPARSASPWRSIASSTTTMSNHQARHSLARFANSFRDASSADTFRPAESPAHACSAPDKAMRFKAFRSPIAATPSSATVFKPASSLHARSTARSFCSRLMLRIPPRTHTDSSFAPASFTFPASSSLAACACASLPPASSRLACRPATVVWLR